MGAERIPESIKPYLNELIRVGKRYIHQDEEIFKPLERYREELYERMFKKITKLKSKHFSIKKVNYTSSPIFKYKGSSGYLEFDLYKLFTGENSFSEIFEDAITCLSRELKNYSHILTELHNFILDVKKEIAYEFLQYTRITPKYNNIKKAIDNKWRRLIRLKGVIEREWQKKYPLKRGHVIYYAHSKGDEIRKGKVAKIEGEDVYITAASGKIVQRYLITCNYRNKLEATEMYKNIEKLLWEGIIPEAWQEKRLDLY